MTPLEPGTVLHVLVQLGTVLLVALGAGGIARRLGQPAAVGQVVGGALVGPGALGAAAPRWTHAWLPEGGTAPLLVLAALGAVVLLALAGADLDRAVLRERARQLPWLMFGATVPPLAAGYAVGRLLPDGFLGTGATRTTFALTVAVLVGISSPPMMAAVLAGLRLGHRSFAQVAMTTAVVTDVVGWTVLGATVGTGGPHGPVVAVAGIALLAAAVPVLSSTARRWGPRWSTTTRTGAGLATVALLAAGAERAGLEPVLGAFAAGLVVGSVDDLRREVDAVLRPLATHVLGPVFFVVAGLRVDLARLGSPAALGWTAALVVVASVAKVAGAGVPWWLAGRPRSEAVALGAVLNVRGSLGIVVAGVGLSTGIFGPTAYTSAVVVALTTSVLAAPLVRTAFGREGLAARQAGSTA